MKVWSEVSVWEGGSFKAGDTVKVHSVGAGEGNGVSLRVLDTDGFDHRLAIVTKRPFLPTLVLYRLVRTLRMTGKYLVVLADIWKLADWRPATVPTWRDIHALKWLARLEDKICSRGGS